MTRVWRKRAEAGQPPRTSFTPKHREPSCNVGLVTRRLSGLISKWTLGIVFVSALAILSSATTVHAQSPEPTTTIAPAPETTAAPTTTAVPLPLAPVTYVADVLAFIERYAYRVPLVDWPAIRSRAEAKAAGAVTIADTYPIILEAVKALGDKHSSFTKPVDAVKQTAGNYTGFGFLASMPSRVVVTIAPGGPAARAGLRVGDRIDKVDGKTPPIVGNALAVGRRTDGTFADTVVLRVARPQMKRAITLTLRRGEVTLVSIPVTTPPPKVVIPREFGYLDVPGIVGDAGVQKNFATQVQGLIRDLDDGSRCGWIVDLRKNRGGYIYALLAGLGPLLGDTVVGGSRNAKGEVTSWSYRAGVVSAGDTATVSVDAPHVLRRPGAAVAVLTSGLTASAGEASVIFFRGATNARSFGEPTIGLTTFNIRHALSDGAFLDITNAVDVDRNATPYDGPIVPDEPVAIDWVAVNNGNDAAMQSASSWLRSQPSCTTPAA